MKSCPASVYNERCDYDWGCCVDLEQFATFLRATQPETAGSFSLDEDGPTRRKFLTRLEGEISKRGIIDVLRKGIKHGAHHLDLFYGTPSPGDEDAKIEPTPPGGGGRPESEPDRLSNIINNFNERFGGIEWSDEDRVRKLITEEIPVRVAADTSYQNARENSDRQNARIECDNVLSRVITGLLQVDTELFKEFMDNDSFRNWVQNTVFDLTYTNDKAA